MAHCQITPQSRRIRCLEVAQFELKIEHQVLRTLKAVAPVRGRWLLALSGGVDSMVLAQILCKWRRQLKVQPLVAYVHHGIAGDLGYRRESREFVRQWAKQHRLTFVTNCHWQQLEIQGEADLRDFRYRCLQRWRRELNCTQIVLGHHRDDLLETRLLRLIRGVGHGGLRAMDVCREYKLRPLLEMSRQEILTYAQSCGLEWIEDSSNQNTEAALRNWLRHDWLPRLENRQPGSAKSLSRSLELLLEDEASSSHTSADAHRNHVGLRRKDLRQAPLRLRQATIVNYLRGQGLQSFTRTHVEEILKRLNSPRRNFWFELLGLRFEVSPDLVWASRV